MKKQLKIRRSDFVVLGSYLIMGFVACSIFIGGSPIEELWIHFSFFGILVLVYLPGWFVFKRWVFQSAPWKRNWSKRLKVELLYSSTSGLYFSLAYCIYSIALKGPSGLSYSTFLVGVGVLMWTMFVNSSGEFLHLIGTSKSMEARVSLGKNEVLKLRKEVLQDLISPHFLFNSLNTISSFVTENKAKSIRIVKELSEMYRFMLRNSHKSVVSLRNDLEMANRYAFLLQSRLEKGIEISFNVDDRYLDFYVPPLTLQNLIENAVKHNAVTKKNRLMIEISALAGLLRVKNNVNPKLSAGNGSTGLGLSYIDSQIEQLSGKRIKIISTNHFYEVELPLIDEESLQIHDFGEDLTLQKLI